MKSSRVAKILEVGPYPPPRAGWSIRIQFVRERLEEMGHDSQALNLGKNRKIPDPRYITVQSGLDYLFKTLRYAARGYTMHMHANGDGPIGFLLTLISAFAGCVFFRRIVLTMHAGTHQRYFPIERSKYFFPILYTFENFFILIFISQINNSRNICIIFFKIYFIIPFIS